MPPLQQVTVGADIHVFELGCASRGGWVIVIAPDLESALRISRVKPDELYGHSVMPRNSVEFYTVISADGSRRNLQDLLLQCEASRPWLRRLPRLEALAFERMGVVSPHTG